MRADVIARCVEALVEDAERLGAMPWARVLAVTSRRGLNADEINAVVLELVERGVVVDAAGTEEQEGARVGLEAPSGGKGWSSLPTAMRNHRVLTAEEEVALGRRIQLGQEAAERLADGDDERLRLLVADGLQAKAEMVRSNIRLVVSVAQRAMAQGGDLEFEDLVQEGICGLHRAAEKFDPSLGYKFSTYATWWIRQAIGRGIDDTGHTVRLPVHVWETVRRIRRYARDFEARNGREATLAEIGEALQMDTADIKGLLDVSAPYVRLDMPVGEGDGTATLADYLLVERGPDVAEIVARESLSDTVNEVLRRRLDPRSLDVIERRFGFANGEEETLDQIGQVYRVSRERIRQIEGQVFKLLRTDRQLNEVARAWGIRSALESRRNR